MPNRCYWCGNATIYINNLPTGGYICVDKACPLSIFNRKVIKYPSHNQAPASDESSRFREMCESMIETYEKKNHDYGDSFHKTFQEYGMVMPCIRLEDKVNRLKSLVDNNAEVTNESVEDTLLDIANYAIMTLMEKKQDES